MDAKPPKTIAVKLQNICIDLPGETVSCWRSTDEVQVTLRKHRDVIIDLKSMPGRKYTVESTGSDFYYSDKKKLIAGASKQRISFNDGERLHLWVSRDFDGELLLKSDGNLLIRVDPNRLDKTPYDALPKTKPDPIIVSIGESSEASILPKNDSRKKLQLGSAQEVRPTAAPIDEDCPVVCVIKGFLEGAPEVVKNAIASGGGNSGLVDIDPFDVATRNWLLGQFAGATAYIGDNWDWLKASFDGKTHKGFKLVKAKIHYVRGKVRFYFSGYSKHNHVFGRGGFGSGHERILGIFSGIGKASTSLTSAAKGILGTFKGHALVAFIFGNVTSYIEWKSDASKDGYDLFASILVSAIKAIVVAAIVAPIVAGILALIMLATEASVAVIAVGALCLGVGLIVSYGVDAVDKKLGKAIDEEKGGDGVSGMLANKIRENVKGNWDYLKRKLLWDYEEVPF